ncbi:MAG: hypothetical protein FJX47_07355 [Alphaproteobacteria bacterium]|nr:hypothetical protein [Alphaproteobacteria bacterium]
MESLPLPIPAGRKVVTGYGQGGFRISGERFAGSILLFPEKVEPWGVVDLDRAESASLAPLLAEAAGTILLIGCGVRPVSVTSPWRRALSRTGRAIEFMDTGAACRTFNVLVAEGRPVAAALIAIP